MTDPAVSPWNYVYGDFSLTIKFNIAYQCSSVINAFKSSFIDSLNVIIITVKLSKVSVLW